MEYNGDKYRKMSKISERRPGATSDLVTFH